MYSIGKEEIIRPMHNRVISSIALMAILLIIPATSALAADAITVTSFGGAYSQSQIKAFQIPYSKKTGIRVNAEDYSGGLAEIRAQVESGNVTWDVVDVEITDATFYDLRGRCC